MNIFYYLFLPKVSMLQDWTMMIEWPQAQEERATADPLNTGYETFFRQDSLKAWKNSETILVK